MLDHFNDLYPDELERLALLSEEMGEVQQIIGKITRHGYESRNPLVTNSLSNREKLAEELGDLEFAISLLKRAADIDSVAVEERVTYKGLHIWKWMHHNGSVAEEGE